MYLITRVEPARGMESLSHDPVVSVTWDLRSSRLPTSLTRKPRLRVWMDYFSKFLRTSNQPQTKNPVDHAQEFHKSWDIIKVGVLWEWHLLHWRALSEYTHASWRTPNNEGHNVYWRSRSSTITCRCTGLGVNKNGGGVCGLPSVGSLVWTFPRGTGVCLEYLLKNGLNNLFTN